MSRIWMVCGTASMSLPANGPISASLKGRHWRMGLLPAYRNAGIGRRLLGAALTQARGRGIERVELHVFSDNVRARHLYESLGFTVEGIHPRRAKIDGQYRDEVAMALVFSPAG
jgi:ribosomal protein S18 acetylase RimI-like enzyme